MSPNRRRNACRRWIPTIAICVLTASASLGDEPAAPPEPARQEPARADTQGIPTRAGLVAFFDPATGEITPNPTAEQIAALAEALKSTLDRSTAGLEPFALATGGTGVFLDGRFQSATVATVHTDGELALQCTDHPEEAAGLLATPPPPPAVVWEER